MNLLQMSIYIIRSGTNQIDKSKYSIVKLYFEQPSEQPNRLPNAQANEQPNELADEHIITKLNILFNYIIYNAQEKFENMASSDRQAIIKILQKLNIYIDNAEILQYFSESKKFEYELQYWAIKELYYSPYKVLLDKLTRQQFLFRFYKAKKYMDLSKCSIYEFSSYFIRCVQGEMEKGGKINDRKE